MGNKMYIHGDSYKPSNSSNLMDNGNVNKMDGNEEEANNDNGSGSDSGVAESPRDSEDFTPSPIPDEGTPRQLYDYFVNKSVTDDMDADITKKHAEAYAKHLNNPTDDTLDTINELEEPLEDGTVTNNVAGRRYNVDENGPRNIKNPKYIEYRSAQLYALENTKRDSSRRFDDMAEHVRDLHPYEFTDSEPESESDSNNYSNNPSNKRDSIHLEDIEQTTKKPKLCLEVEKNETEEIEKKETEEERNKREEREEIERNITEQTIISSRITNEQEQIPGESSGTTDDDPNGKKRANK